MAKYLKWENSFKPKVAAIANFIEKMQKKSDIMKSGLDTISLFLLDNLLKMIKFIANMTVQAVFTTKDRGS